MSKPVLLAFFAVCCTASLAGAREVVKGTAPPPDPAPPAEQQMVATWQEMATPSAGHKLLASLTGTWDAKVRMWTSPAAAPVESQGVSVNRMVLGDRWLERAFEGSMTGQPFHSVGYTGYDNFKKQYMGWSMDTSTTAGMMTIGQSSEDGKAMTFTGAVDDIMTGGVVQMREILTFVDADHHDFQLWRTGSDGKPFKSVEISYSRRK